MMPLSMLRPGETNTIKKVGGKEETRKFLENLGFVTGGEVTVVSEIEGNLIVNVKDSRVAIGKDMANRIMVLAGGLSRKEGECYENSERDCCWTDSHSKEIAW